MVSLGFEGGVSVPTTRKKGFLNRTDHNLVVVKEGKVWRLGSSANYQTGQGTGGRVLVATTTIAEQPA